MLTQIRHLKLPTRARLIRSTLEVCGVLFGILLIGAVLFPVFAQAKMGGGHDSCMSHVRSLVHGALAYSQDYDDRLPDEGRWMDLEMPYVKREREFHDRWGLADGLYGYAFRRSASGKMLDSFDSPAKFELVFDSTLLQRNAHSETSTLPKPGRHGGFDSIGFLDGHAKSLRQPN